MNILITGKSGSGKSTLAKLIAEQLDYLYIDVDSIGHKIYEDKDMLNEISQLFGNDIFDDDGTFNRKKLGKIIFENKDNENVAKFNKITWEFMEHKLDDIVKDNNVVIDYALLPIIKYWNYDSFKILVEAKDDETRFEHLLRRDKVSAEYLKSRDKAGINYSKFKYDYIVVNNFDNSLIKDCNKLCKLIYNTMSK